MPTTEPTPEQRQRLAELFLAQWWVRCLLATEHDMLGAVLRTVAGKLDTSQAVFGPRCTILDDSDPINDSLPFPKDGSGVVWTNVLEANSILPAAPKPVFTTKRFAGAVQKLVDDLELTATEAGALVALVQQWVGTDWRLDAGNLPEDRGITGKL